MRRVDIVPAVPSDVAFIDVERAQPIDHLCFGRGPNANIGLLMELQPLENRDHSHEIDRMIGNAKRAGKFLKALAHESRLTILCILAEGEKSVSELEGMLSLRQPTVSQQLARLRADGLVSTRRDGKMIYYNLASNEARVVIGAMYDVLCRKARKR